MKLCPILAVILVGLTLGPARAAPDVVADIPPVQALVASVMSGIEEPGLLVQPGESVHDHALRPSQARALGRADLVVLVDFALTPWLDRTVQTLSDPEAILELNTVAGTRLISAREEADFEGGNHGSHQHDADAVDPHSWLDPQNARVWLDAIAMKLSELDPANSELYATNAAAAWSSIGQAASRLGARLDALPRRPILVGHDELAYLEARYGLRVVGAISLSDAASPGPVHLSELRRRAAQDDLACLLVAEPADPKAIALADSAGLSAVPIDPLGQTLPPGPDLYVRLLDGLGDALERCLTDA